MNRDELLEKLAMELAEWPKTAAQAKETMPPGFYWRGICVINESHKHFREDEYLAERERLINKPSWDELPSEANYLFQNSGGGLWFWSERPPNLNDLGWRHTGGDNRYVAKGAIPAGHRWQDTLEQRPTLTTSLGASEQPYCPMIDSEMSPADAINPDHYKIGGIETIDYMKAKATPDEFRGHLRLTAIKYLSRAGHKDELLREYRKAAWYLDRLINELEATQ